MKIAIKSIDGLSETVVGELKGSFKEPFFCKIDSHKVKPKLPRKLKKFVKSLGLNWVAYWMRTQYTISISVKPYNWEFPAGFFTPTKATNDSETVGAVR